MSDHTELVKRLRSIRWTGMVEAADAIEEQAATIARLQSEIGNYELANEGQFHDIARLSAELQLATEAFRDRIRDVRSEIVRLQDELLQSTEATRYVAIQRDGLSARLEAEVQARHEFMGWQQGWCPTSIGAACACEWTGRVPVGARSETEAEAEHAAHVAEAVAEALGGQP